MTNVSFENINIDCRESSDITKLNLNEHRGLSSSANKQFDGHGAEDLIWCWRLQ